MHKLKLVLWGMVALLVAACQEEEVKDTQVEDLGRPAKIALAQQSLHSSIQVFPGVTAAARSSTLAFRVEGQITDLPAIAGKFFNKGDLIARLDDAPYQNVVADRKATYELARLDLDRQQALFDRKHIAESRLDEARSTYEARKASLKAAQDDLSYTRLVAPFDGIVSVVEVDNFNNVQAKEAIVQFHGAKAIDVVFDIPESLFVKLPSEDAENGHVTLVFDSIPDRVFDAYYKEHETSPDAATRAFEVTVSMPLPEDVSILPGMTVSVSLDLSKYIANDAEGVLVPLEAVFEQEGQTWVWTLDSESRAVRRMVSSSKIEGEYVRIVDGLQDGDPVIAVGVDHVAEGQKIRPMTKERGI
ncbi:efflux RND transporter periplasmic adaptor subunit [Curvivirga sp.]|uniref:efflux RND transporter periplasmic adaptor subunit n=1 Tax=Curvivirga sp. TaxID=2856848 RepID=UPI003B5C44A3